jgi:hypothetical protein
MTIPYVRPWRIPPRPFGSPRSDAHRRYRIKIEKAVRLVRIGSNTRAACRSVGLHDDAAFSEVNRLCDKRSIPRRFRWGTPLAVWKTHEPFPAHVKPRAR